MEPHRTAPQSNHFTLIGQLYPVQYVLLAWHLSPAVPRIFRRSNYFLIHFTFDFLLFLFFISFKNACLPW